jgi:cysteine desulfurase
MDVVYLDNNASTRVDPRVLAAAMPLLTERYGNSSSLHDFGASVGADIEHARSQVAAAIGARETEIVFTSGGTESDNAALRGVLAARPQRRRLVISAVEHHAILEPAEALEREGVEVLRVPVDADGGLDLAALEAAVNDETALVSIMLANNETGVVFPLPRVAEIVQRRKALLHSDAVNALGKMRVDVGTLDVDLLSISGHKLHGLKGCGALYLRRGTAFVAQIVGGPQERQLRAGTHNAAGIVALGTACELFAWRGDEPPDIGRVRELRDRLEREIAARIPNAHVIAATQPRLPNTSCICFAGAPAEAALILLSQMGICASSGAACSSGSLEPSHVLRAMNVDPAVAQGQIRFSLSRLTTHAEIDRVLAVLPGVVEKVRASSVQN